MNSLADFQSKFRQIFESVSKRKPFVAGDLKLTYGELEDRIGRTVGLFRELGLSVGDRIMVTSTHELEVSVLYLAMLQAGLVAVVVDPHSSKQELATLLGWTEPKYLFIDNERRSKVSTLPSSTRCIEIHPETSVRRTTFGLLLGKSKSTPANPDFFPANTESSPPVHTALGLVEDDQTALILFTSGTTSRPKGVELSRRNLFAQFETLQKQYLLNASSVLLNHLPLHHTDGLNQGAAITIFTGATWLRPHNQKMSNLSAVLDMVFKENATHLVTVPTVLALMLRLGPEVDDTFSSPGFRFVGSTAGYLEEKLWREFEGRFSVRVVNSYGLTETVSEAIYCGPDEATRKMGTIGKPIDCEARILDDNGNEVGRGKIGEIAIRGENVMKGYFRDPESTAAVFKDDWFLSGDLGIQDEEGFFSVVGRKKNVIIRGGLNVYPEEITDTVLKMPGVLDAVTIGVSDELLGERVVTCITLDGSTKVSSVDVFAYLRECFAPEKVPSDIYFVENLPRGPAGKVVISEVKSIIENIRNQAMVTISGSAEERVLKVAASVFKVDPSILRLDSRMTNTEGWDSLTHLELVLRLEQMAKKKFSPRHVLRLTTLEDAVAILTEIEGVR
jgi:long-chain acyl-CoA synthetase